MIRTKHQHPLELTEEIKQMANAAVFTIQYYTYGDNFRGRESEYRIVCRYSESEGNDETIVDVTDKVLSLVHQMERKYERD